MKQPNPAGGKAEGLLDNDRARKHQPKNLLHELVGQVLGRRPCRTLVHTSTDGRHDLTLPPNVRAYLFSGTQHCARPVPPRVTTGQPDQGTGGRCARFSVR